MQLYSKYKVKSITFETTFGLCKQKGKDLPVGTAHWRSFGKDIVQALASFYQEVAAISSSGHDLLDTIKLRYFPKDRAPPRTDKKTESSVVLLDLLRQSGGRVKSETHKKQIHQEEYDSAESSSGNDCESQAEDLS
jgi:hypothetical protein